MEPITYDPNRINIDITYVSVFHLKRLGYEPPAFVFGRSALLADMLAGPFGAHLRHIAKAARLPADGPIAQLYEQCAEMTPRLELYVDSVYAVIAGGQWNMFVYKK